MKLGVLLRGISRDLTDSLIVLYTVDECQLSTIMEYKHYNHAVGLAMVHLIWIPCRRRKIFYQREDLKQRCAEIFYGVAKEHGWFIKALEIASDHVHLLLEYDPTHSIAQVVKAFKGRSSRLLRQEFPELLRLPSLWTHSYGFDTTGKISTQKILDSINDPHHG